MLMLYTEFRIHKGDRKMGDRQDTTNQLLYHYTDYSALDGIVNKQELRVNNVLNMNDATEMELFITGIFNAVKKRFDPKENEKIIQQLNVMREKVRERYFDFSIYAACFSGFRDDAAQWERYANQGKGVCLCFQKPVLEKMTGGAISLRKVYYQNDLDSHPLVEHVYNLVLESKGENDSPALREALHEAWRNCATFKHPSFLSENETRLIVMPFEVEFFEIKPQYHITKERIKKYYPLDLNTMCLKAGVTLEDLITEIMIGPESTQSAPILRDYLRDLGLGRLAEHIIHSDCPLRSRI